MPVKINSDKRGLRIHIHVPHSHVFLIVSSIFLVLCAIGGYFAYRYYTTTVSYINKKELQGYNFTPPPDIKNEIQQMIRQIQQQKIAQFIITPTPTRQKVAASNVAVASISGTIRVPILMYHYIEYVQDERDKIRISLNITPYTLDQQIQTLIGAGYTFMTENDLDDILDGLKPLPKNPILLTFDDGYRDFATDAYPILKKYHVKATAYIVPGFLDRPNYMFKSQLDTIANDDLVELANHTVDHLGLARQSLKAVSDEVFRSKIMLEEEIHKPVVDFAYPYGSFDDQAIQVVKDAGFRSAVSTLPGIEQGQTNRYFLFRLRPGYRTGQTLLNWLQQTTFSAY